MAAPGQGVDVGVAGNPSPGVDFAPNFQLRPASFFSDLDIHPIDSPLGSLGGPNRQRAGRHVQDRLPIHPRVGDSVANGKGPTIQHPHGNGIPISPMEGQARGDPFSGCLVAHGNFNFHDSQNLAQGHIEEADVSDDDVVGLVVRNQRKGIGPGPKRPSRNSVVDLLQFISVLLQDREFLAVELNRPAVADVALGEEKGALRPRGPGAEFDFQL